MTKEDRQSSNRGSFYLQLNKHVVYVREDTLIPLIGKEKVNQLIQIQQNKKINDEKEEEPWEPPVPGRVRVILYVIHLHDGLTIPLLMNEEKGDAIIKAIVNFIYSNTHFSNNISELLSVVIKNTKEEEDERPSPYLYFAFNELTSTHIKYRKCNVSHTEEESFSLTINWAHDLFRKRSFTKLILRNNNGSFYCRKQFGKEVFFRDVPTKFDDIEDTARKILNVEHDISLI